MKNNPEAKHLENIYRAARKVKFSKNLSAQIIGSRKKLEELVGRGLISVDKKTDHQHGKWNCNGSDVLRYAKGD